MAETAEPQIEPNRRIGSIEHVGSDGFIVESADPRDPNFIGGKRLFKDFDDLLRFLASYLKVYKSPGNIFGIKPPEAHEQDEEESQQQEGIDLTPKSVGGNGAGRHETYIQRKDCPTQPQVVREVGMR
jgi:hypothetical protein